MLCKKKPTDRAESEEESKELILDFAWIVFIGMQIGYTEKEVASMYFGKWCDLFEQYKKMHNIRMKKALFEEPKKVVSLYDI